jgi:hypothetical protein
LLRPPAPAAEPELELLLTSLGLPASELAELVELVVDAALRETPLEIDTPGVKVSVVVDVTVFFALMTDVTVCQDVVDTVAVARADMVEVNSRLEPPSPVVSGDSLSASVSQ